MFFISAGIVGDMLISKYIYTISTCEVWYVNNQETLLDFDNKLKTHSAYGMDLPDQLDLACHSDAFPLTFTCFCTKNMIPLHIYPGFRVLKHTHTHKIKVAAT